MWTHYFSNVPPNEYLTVTRFARNVKVTPKTVRKWIRLDGLPVVDPTAARLRIHGATAKAWAKARYAAQKCGPLPWNSFYCVGRCKSPALAIAGSVHATPPGRKLGRGNVRKIDLFGLCATCGALMCRFSSTAKAPAILDFYRECTT